MMTEIATLIRLILHEELSKLKDTESSGNFSTTGMKPTKIRSSHEFDEFANRLIEKCQSDILKGRGSSGNHPHQRDESGVDLNPTFGSKPDALEHLKSQSAIASSNIYFSEGIVTESDIRRVPDGISVLHVGKATKLTPLAQDEIRRREIKLERV